MLFGYNKIDSTIDENFARISATASDPATLIFLDTNILAYLFKLHTSARHEFFDWLDRIVCENRLAIPAWAASEYLSRVTSKGLAEFTPKSKEPSQILKALDAMHDTAALFVDVPLLQKVGITSDRVTFLNDFRAAIESLRKNTRIFTEQFDPGHIHEEIVSHLGTSIINSDLVELSNRAAKSGNARYEHRLPPGYLDGEKDKNRFGDLIIWYEILDKSASSATVFANVLFITNDEKSDWVYAPKMRSQIVAGLRKPVGNSNPEIKIADPRLISEFTRAVGHSQLTICSLATLVESLSKVNASQFMQLAAAIQINIDESNATVQPSNESTGSESELAPPILLNAENVPEPILSVLEENPENPAEAELPADPELPVPPVVENRPEFHYQAEALADNQFQIDAPSDINDVIKALKSHNWYTQNPAIAKIRAIRDQLFTPSSWFVLGRNVYQAACGNSQKAMEFMATLDSQLLQFPDQTAQHLLSGMLFEIYFDSNGDFRRVLKFSYADKTLSLVAHEKYTPARNFIRFCLRGHMQGLKFVPGDRDEKTLTVISTLHEQVGETLARVLYKLESVVLDEIELLRKQEDGDDMQIDGGSVITLQNLRDTIAEELAIPRWALSTNFQPGVPPDVRFFVPEGYTLCPKWAVQE
jgi:predicted nucleic acid-binding protein